MVAKNQQNGISLLAPLTKVTALLEGGRGGGGDGGAVGDRGAVVNGSEVGEGGDK